MCQNQYNGTNKKEEKVLTRLNEFVDSKDILCLCSRFVRGTVIENEKHILNWDTFAQKLVIMHVLEIIILVLPSYLVSR